MKLAKEIQDEELNLKFMERERAVTLEEEESKVRKTKADATYYETTRTAEAEARKSVISGEAEAKIRRDEGAAEAEVIRERGKAEAESRKLLAEAMEQHGDVIITEKLIDMLPIFAEKVAAPLNNIDSVKIIDSGNGQGIPSFGRSVTKTMVDMQEPLKEMTGIDIGELLKSYVGKTPNQVVQAAPVPQSRNDAGNDLPNEEQSDPEADDQ